MQLDRNRLRDKIHEHYRRDHALLGEAGALSLLDEARKWNLAPTLSAGGVIVFSHAGVVDCGHQIAAAVHACLDSGADRVLVISVLHAFTDEMEAARIRVANGGDVAQEKFWVTFSDATLYYEQPAPTWVAAALQDWRPSDNVIT